MENLPKHRTLAQENRPRSGRPGSSADRRAASIAPSIAVAPPASDVRLSQLARTIEQEIIPRLMLAHRASPEPRITPQDPGALDTTPLGPDDVERLAKLVLAAEEDAALDAVLQHRSRGIRIDAIYLNLLAPTARYLGDLWVEDLCDFTDVTVGLGRLQRVLRELSPSFGRAAPHPFDGRRVLLLPCPGEQHTFGLSIVAEFFRHAGWDVAGDARCDVADVGEAAMRVAGEWFDVAGFSLGSEVRLQDLEDAIRAVRQASCNRYLSILVGGPLFSAHPDYADRVGADGVTIDGREAPALAEQLMAQAAGARAVAQARRLVVAGPVGVDR